MHVDHLRSLYSTIFRGNGRSESLVKRRVSALGCEGVLAGFADPFAVAEEAWPTCGRLNSVHLRSLSLRSQGSWVLCLDRCWEDF